PTNNISDSPTWDQKPKRTKRKHSHSFGSRNNPTNTATTTTTQPRKPGRPKRDKTDYLLSNPQSALSDNSLDSLYDSSGNHEPSSIHYPSPIVLRRTTRQLS
ncbi:unnamed protein product, partial [Rotaria socialis]